MASLQSDGVDDLLFDLYKKQLLRHLRSKMPADMLSTLSTLKDGGGSTSDFALRKPRLDYFLASMVAGQDGHTFPVSDSYLSGLKSRLESLFGYILSKEVISGIVDVVASSSLNTPSTHVENEKLVIDLLNFLVGSSCIKMKGSDFVTPPSKRKDGIVISLDSPKAPVKKANHMQEPYDVDAKVLFPEVEVIRVVDGASRISKESSKVEHGVVFIKEVSLNDKLKNMCKTSEALYNKNNCLTTGVDVDGATTMQNGHSPSLSIVSGYRVNVPDVVVAVNESARFPVTSQEKTVYNAVCSLAKSKHANSTVVDIGGCKLKYFALGESMIAGNQVCTFVINVFCRKYFLDERPSVSKKHYFFSSVAEVFLSDSPNYSSVQNCFNGAGSVIPWQYLICSSSLCCAQNTGSYLSSTSRSISLCSLIHTIQSMMASVFLPGKNFAWSQFVGLSGRFSDFRAAYPRVPKQDNVVDCGIFVIKFMEFFWEW